MPTNALKLKTKTKRITIDCPRCEHTVRIREPESGRAPRCPGCKEVVGKPRPPSRRKEKVKLRTERTARVSERAGAADEDVSLEARMFSSGLAGGVLAMVVALVWFAVGWSAGTIYLYPPVLFVIGLGAVIKSLLDPGRPARPRRRPAR